MSVLIGHASISETGGINGTPGDSTGREVCTCGWYDGGWKYMALHPSATVRNRHAAAVEAACANNNIGYGQGDRNTLNALARANGYDLSKVGPCNCDCSSLQNVAAVASGAPGVSYGSNGWTTGDWSMLAALRAAGYLIVTDKSFLRSESFCVRGAIYVSEGHTACGLSNGAQAGKTLALLGADTGSGTAESPDEGTTAQEGKEYRIPGAQYHAYLYKVDMNLLKIGDKGALVHSMQLLLTGKGFPCDTDGVFGSETFEALKDFQTKAGILADGECGGQSWAALVFYRI